MPKQHDDPYLIIPFAGVVDAELKYRTSRLTFSLKIKITVVGVVVGVGVFVGIALLAR